MDAVAVVPSLKDVVSIDNSPEVTDWEGGMILQSCVRSTTYWIYVACVCDYRAKDVNRKGENDVYTSDSARY